MVAFIATSHNDRLKALHSAPFPEQFPVGVIAGEGKPTVRPPEQVLLLVVVEGGIPPALLSTLHLEVVE